MVDYRDLRRKFPSKDTARRRRAAAVKAIAREFAAKRAALGGGPPGVRRGFPYYMTVAIGMLILGGLVGTAIFRRGGIDIAKKNNDKAVVSVKNLAIAAGRYRYHVGRFPTTAEGLVQLASKRVVARGWNGPYVKKINKDPWGNDYVYVCDGETETPTLYSKGPDGLAGTTDDIMADPADFDLAFRNTEWTREWVPQHLRDIVVAQDERHKRALQAEVDAILHPRAPVEGTTRLHRDEWRRDGDTEFFRSSVTVPKAAAGKYIALRFGGASGPVEVRLNGEAVGGCYKPFSAFDVDITRKIRIGEDNVVCVPGCAFCRDVSLVVEDPEDRVFPGSLKAETLSLTGTSAVVRVSYLTPKGPVVNEFETPNPRLWTPERPSLYTGYIGNDLYRYAIRTVAPDPQGGLLLNGAATPANGVEMPPDVAYDGFGAFDPSAARSVLQKLKDMGANAVLPTVSPGADFCDLCDEMGFLVFGDDAPFRPASSALAVAKIEDVLDPTGQPRDRYWTLRAKWNKADDTVKLLRGADGAVEVAASGDEAELFADGESLWRRGAGDGGGWTWTVPEDTFEVKAIAYRNGLYIGEDAFKRPGKPVSVRLDAEKKALAEGEATIVVLEVVDEYGVVDGKATGEATFAVQGLGSVIAVGNADGCKAAGGGHATVALAGGRAAAAIRRKPAGSGLPVKVTGSIPGLRSETIVLPRR